MKVLIIGATGGTGQELLRQALEHGHTVTALARTPAAIDMRHERLTIVQGSVLEATLVEKVVTGQQAVLSALVDAFGRSGGFAPTTTEYEHITGKRPITFEQFSRDYAGALR
jgi:putative NADH-flavin reductase